MPIRRYNINAFPYLVTSDVTRIFDVSPKPGRGSGDRPRDTVAVVRIGTKYTKTLGPTARRHTRTLRLGTAPRSPHSHSVIRGGSGERR